MSKYKKTFLTLNRTSTTLIISFALIIALGLLRPVKNHGMYEGQFWATKWLWKNCASMILTGDSRVGIGISPAEMQKTLTDSTILNFGFSFNIYTIEYLDAIEETLYANCKNKTIILGITPSSLIEMAWPKNAFIHETQKTKTSRFMDLNFPFFNTFFSKLDIEKTIKIRMGKEQSIVWFRNYHPNGWREVDIISRKRKSTLERFKKRWDGLNLSPETAQLIFEYTRRWVKKGISVYAFRPPCSQELYELENELLGFEQDLFISQFRNAGGTWLNSKPFGYETVDQSHLGSNAALAFSRDLAILIKKDTSKK